MALPQKPNCDTSKLTGKYVALDINWEQCGNVADPTLLEFKPLGGLQTKGLDRSQATEDVTDDRTVGDYAELLGLLKNFSLSGSGIMNHTDNNVSNLATLDKLYSQDGPTYIHVRITEPHITTYAYCLLTNFSKQWPATAPITFDLEIVATTSEYGVVVKETGVFETASGVSLAPSSLSLSVGDSIKLNPSVLPAGAEKAYTWESSDPTFATVSANGTVTAIADGVATITVKHATQTALTDTCTVTVTA